MLNPQVQSTENEFKRKRGRPKGSVLPERFRLTPNDQFELCRMISMFERPKEISKYFQSKGKSVDRDLIHIYKYSEKWKPVIQKFHDQYLASLSSVPIANKVKRVEKLGGILDRSEDLEENSGSYRLKLLAMEKQMDALKQAHEEVEGRVQEPVQNYYFTQFNQMSPKEFEEYRLGLVEKIMRYKNQKEVVHASSQ